MAQVQGTSAFPKIYHDTDPEFASLLNSQVEITEKLDGSQVGSGYSRKIAHSLEGERH